MRANVSAIATCRPRRSIAAGAPAPQPAGSQQSMAVGGVSGSTVYFAIRTLDMEGNVSALSNVAW